MTAEGQESSTDGGVEEEAEEVVVIDADPVSEPEGTTKVFCLMGLDSQGFFKSYQIESIIAAVCERSTCTCDSHEDFLLVVAERVGPNS